LYYKTFFSFYLVGCKLDYPKFCHAPIHIPARSTELPAGRQMQSQLLPEQSHSFSESWWLHHCKSRRHKDSIILYAFTSCLPF